MAPPALERATELEARMQERRAFVIDQIARADAAMRAGRPNESVAIRAMLMEKYSQYTDLTDLLGPPPQTPRSGTAAPGADVSPAHSGETLAPVPQPSPDAPETHLQSRHVPARTDSGRPTDQRTGLRPVLTCLRRRDTTIQHGASPRP